MFVQTADARLRVETFGRALDPALILVMGATASMLWWPDSLCNGLAATGLHVIRYDSRDTGESSACPPGAPNYAVEDLARDLLAVADGLGLGSAHVMGMSLGGYVAQMAALMAPGRVRSLTLLASEPLGWTGAKLPGISPRFLALFEGFETLDWADADAVVAFQLTLSQACAGSAHPFDPAATAATLRADYARATNPAAAFNHGMLNTAQDWAGAVNRLALPVLVLHGTEDPILPLPNGQALAETIPGARLVVMQGVGHELPEALVPRVLGEVAGFLHSL